MPYLEAPNAQLYYETVGEGPTLLCISGADGSCEIWRQFAECLKKHFTVVMWDRRGFSRSYLTGAQDYDHRIETDTEDAVRLIDHFSPDAPAIIIGNSSGAIVALKLLVRYPDRLRICISYEPPAAKVLPEFDNLWRQHEDVYDTYRQSGIHPALQKFAKVTKADQANLMQFIDFSRPYLFSNTMYWFEREFMVYPRTDFDVERDLLPVKDKLVLVNGALSPREAYQYRASSELAAKLELRLREFPGEHVGHATHAQEFGERLVYELRARGDLSEEISQ